MEKGRLIIDGVDVSGSVGSAASVPYSNTNSGLEATNTQGAIDELATSVTELNSKLTNSENESFYFDIQNGVRGYNTDAARGADTFFPFSSLKTVILAKADYNNNCRDMDNIQPDVYNPEYINIDKSGVITFKKACNVFVMGFCQSHVNNGYAQPTLAIGDVTLTYGTRDSYYFTYLNPAVSYISVNEGDVFSFRKKHQFQIDADNGYGYIVMLSGK